ncbi:ABC transporter substrate-binding protein [Rhodococcoides fascians]|uniref:ABC transporter substrate-binding protein n=1 Tax=Rhodococcoides fascians TaxID=1828 RepID=UPI00277E6B94|nr:ABC transporter substrate-binding protein [Rhodococcus fascians]MDQ0282148.1 NitT/TauT family transport system substrate-binding protein [Rhodococcus fascians]
MAPRSTVTTSSLVALAAITALFAGACTRPATESAAATSSTGSIRIAVGIDASYAPFFVADEQGLFEKAGLDVELVQFGRGGEAVDALSTGQVQMAGSSDTTTIAQLQQNPALRAMYSYESSGKYIKVVLRNGVDGPQSIRKLGIVAGLSQISTVKYLEANGVSPDSVEMISATPTDMPALLSRGDIDGYVMWEPWPSAAIDQGTGKVVATTGDFDWFYHHWAITTQSWLDGNEDTARAVRDVLSEATAEVEADPQAAAAATKTAVNVDEAQTVQSIDEIDYAVEDLTPTSVAAAQSVVDFYTEIGAMNNQPDLNTALLVGWSTEGSR